MTQPAPQAATSGRDLARQALADYKASTWAVPNRTNRPAKKRPQRRHGDRRDPVLLSAALRDVSAEPVWDSALQGGGIRGRWAAIAPELVGKVDAEGFDPASRTLALRPVSPAYAAQLRLLGPQLVARINAAAGAGAVRSLRVLPPGTVGRGGDAPDSDVPTPRSAAEQPARTRADASQGFHRALAAHQTTHATESADEPGRELRDRYFADVRGSLREPKPEPAAPLIPRTSDSDDARQRALARLRAEANGQAVPGFRRLGETA